MSKVKPKKSESAVNKTPNNDKKNNKNTFFSKRTEKKKKFLKQSQSNDNKKTFFFDYTANNKKILKHTFTEEEKERKSRNVQHLPPKDGQGISANWKTLLEVLKSNPVVEKKKPPNDIPEMGTKAKPVQVNPRKTGKDGGVPSHSRENGNGPSKSQQPKAKKRKAEDSQTVNDKEMSKKKKPLKDIPKTVNPWKTTEDGGVPGHSRENENGPSESEQPKAKKRKGKDGQTGNDKQTTEKKRIQEEATDRKPIEEDIWFDDVDPDDLEATVGPEVADIMRRRLGLQRSNAQSTESALVKEHAFQGLTRAIAIDCEMVGVGPDGEESILARVSLVNQFGKCIYDKHVKPTEKVTDYRTAFSGIRPDDIKDGEDIRKVQSEVAEMLQGRILVGHALHNDLKILLLDHPKKKTRDTQKYKPFRRAVKSGRPSLKLLSKEILNVRVQQGEHSSVQDAQATMRLYTMAKKQWEAELKASRSQASASQKSQRKPKAPKSQKKTDLGSGQARAVSGP